MAVLEGIHGCFTPHRSTGQGASSPRLNCNPVQVGAAALKCAGTALPHQQPKDLKSDMKIAAMKRFEWSVRDLAQPSDIQSSLFPGFVCVPDELALEFDEWRKGGA